MFVHFDLFQKRLIPGRKKIYIFFVDSEFRIGCWHVMNRITFIIIFLGGLEESKLFLKALKLVTLAESLGGYESLAELPYLMTHASIEEKERVSLGVTNNLIRLSVGLENPQDLIEDLDQALKAACQVVRKWFNPN